MNLRYIYTGIHNTSPTEYTKDQDYCWDFNANFISDYLSRKVRKLKIDVPEFNMLYITVCKQPNLRHHFSSYLKSLEVNLPFSQGDMDNLTRITNFTERIEAYLSIYEKGYYLANEYCDIPVGILLGLHQQFREEGYRHEWLFKKKIIKEYGIYVFFKCYFTSIDFRLELEVYNQKQTILLTKGVVLQKLPDWICFGKDFNKGIQIDGNKMYLLDFLEERAFEFDLEQLSNGIFNVKVLGYNATRDSSEYLNYLNRINWMK